MEKQKFKAHQNGWVETIFNRRLYLPELNTSNQRMIAEAERIAINMPIQGSAADIIKIAMNNIYNKIKLRDDFRMIIQVHDELVFEVNKEIIDDAISLIKCEMENALPKEYSEIVKMVVDVKCGENWSI
jgi:DNA polymerase-1